MPRALLVVLLLASSLGEAASPPSFREQVDAYARGLSLTVDWVSDAQLDEDPELEHLARLCTPSEEYGSGLYVLEQAPGVLWSISPDAEKHPCPSTPPGTPPTRLELSLDEYRVWSSGSVAFREGRPVLLESSTGGAIQGESIGNHSAEEDWEKLFFSNSSASTKVSEEGEEIHHKSSFEGAILPVLASPRAAARLPPTLNRVTHGAKQWTGERDASLRVAALAQGTDAVRLRIQVRDDVAVPATSELSDRALLGTDHLELWWVVIGGQEPSTRQLAVARTREGSLFARWLHPEGLTEPLPSLAFDRGAFLVDLPLSSLGVRQPEGSWQTRFTVAFSDSDAPGVGQQTLVATSTLRWNEPETFGRLVSFPGHTRYPPVEQISWEDVYSEPPRRLELTDAGLPVLPEQAPPAAQPEPPAAQPESPTAPPDLTAPPHEQPRWLRTAGAFLPYLLVGAFFVALVAGTSRRDASRILLVLGGLVAVLAFALPFSLTFDNQRGALPGPVVLQVFAVTNLVLLPLSVVLTWKLSRTPGPGRLRLACALAAIYLLAVLSLLKPW